MRAINDELKRLKKVIEDSMVRDDFKMAREPDEDDTTGTLIAVRPKVCIGNIPHSNFSLYIQDGRWFQAPYILVGYKKASFEDDGENIDILIQACAYTQEYYEGKDDGVSFPDNMGVLDVTTLLEMIAGWIENNGPVSFSKPYDIGTYATEGFTYPYAFGYLEFKLETGVGSLRQRRFYE